MCSPIRKNLVCLGEWIGKLNCIALFYCILLYLFIYLNNFIEMQCTQLNILINLVYLYICAIITTAFEYLHHLKRKLLCPLAIAPMLPNFLL